MAEWRECKLGDLVSVLNGYAFKSTDFIDSGVPVIKIKNVKPNKIVLDNLSYVSESVAEGKERFQIKPNDILLTMSGNRADGSPDSWVGKAAIFGLNGKYLLNQRVSVLRASPELASDRYLGYFLSSWEIQLLLIGNANSSGGQANISPDTVKAIDLLLPPLPEQKAIAGVLSSLDDKIDLLHRQNKTLEALAETLFRQWFVEEAQEDWAEGCLGDVAELNPTSSLKKGAVSPYLEMKNVGTSTFAPDDWVDREFTSGMKFRNGDTLLARITPCLENGKTCFVAFLEDGQTGWGSTEFIVIRMKAPFHPFTSYVLARHNDFRDFVISNMTGSSGRQRAQADVVATYDMLIPPLDVIERLNEHLESTINKLVNNAGQIRTLEKLRDTLLPKLMSGEVRVAL